MCGWESPHRRSPSPARALRRAHPELRCAALRAGPRTLGSARDRAGSGQRRRPPRSPAAPTAAGGGSGTRPEQAGQRRPRPARRAPAGPGSPAQRGGPAIYRFSISPSSWVSWRGLSEVKFSASSKGNKPRRAELF